MADSGKIEFVAHINGRKIDKLCITMVFDRNITIGEIKDKLVEHSGYCFLRNHLRLLYLNKHLGDDKKILQNNILETPAKIRILISASCSPYHSLFFRMNFFGEEIVETGNVPCSICMDRIRTMFCTPCLHTYCTKCSETLDGICYFCKQEIWGCYPLPQSVINRKSFPE